MSMETSDIIVTEESVIDGTFCSYEIANDICVGGRCQVSLSVNKPHLTDPRRRVFFTSREPVFDSFYIYEGHVIMGGGEGGMPPVFLVNGFSWSLLHFNA